VAGPSYSIVVLSPTNRPLWTAWASLFSCHSQIPVDLNSVNLCGLPVVDGHDSSIQTSCLFSRKLSRYASSMTSQRLSRFPRASIKASREDRLSVNPCPSISKRVVAK